MVLTHLEIEKLVSPPRAPVTIGPNGTPISISEQLSQDGLNNFLGLGDAGAGFRVAVVWQAMMVDRTCVLHL